MLVRVIEPISVRGSRIEPSSDPVELDDSMAESLAALGCVEPVSPVEPEADLDPPAPADPEPSRRKRNR